MRDLELRETTRAAFARYDEDASGAIDARELRRLVEDLGGALTDRDLSAALRVLDSDGSGTIELDEFVRWWTRKATDLDSDGAVSDLEKTLERLKEFGRERFRVDIHTAAWRGFLDVVRRLVQDDGELVHEKDTTEYGNLNTALHYAAYCGHVEICALLHGANVNAANGSGCTPVFYAAQQSHGVVASQLIQHHLSPIDVCHDGAILQLFQSLSGSAPGAPDAPVLSDAGESSVRVTWFVPALVLWVTEAAVTPERGSDRTPPRVSLNEVAPISLFKLRLTSSTAPVRTSVRLQWTRNEEGEATQFVVQQSLGSKIEDGWKVVYKGDAQLTSCVVENLFQDRRYRFRVAAVNSTGRGGFSTPVVVRIGGSATSS
ncbi:hypothetical protein PybrP1_010242, partial [[Pythium] brassicae (nom. inval.)]